MTVQSLARHAAQVHQRSVLKVGMPHLGFAGLSDSWLLQYLGHVHWTLIESAVGQCSADWADAAGGRLYASFVALELQGPLLAGTREGDALHCESRLERLGSALYLSEHRLVLGGISSLTASAQLITTFVRRSRIGDNRSFERATDGPTVSRGPAPSRRRPALLDAYRQQRVLLATTGEAPGQTFPVVPPEDFNGAGMVYFASYVRYVDRADWLVAGAAVASRWHVHRRRVFYYGNLNVGDSVCVEHLERNHTLTRARLRRAGEGEAIAYCETERR